MRFHEIPAPGNSTKFRYITKCESNAYKDIQHEIKVLFKHMLSTIVSLGGLLFFSLGLLCAKKV